jgi:hypothetical protein
VEWRFRNESEVLCVHAIAEWSLNLQLLPTIIVTPASSLLLNLWVSNFIQVMLIDMSALSSKILQNGLVFVLITRTTQSHIVCQSDVFFDVSVILQRHGALGDVE